MSSSDARKVGSIIASSNARSSASMAGISVSGTYRPPKAPNRSLAVVVALPAMVLSVTALSLWLHRIAECAHSRVVLDAGRALYARRNIDDVRRDDAHRLRDVVSREPARQHDARAHALAIQCLCDRPPVERGPGAAELPRYLRVEHDRVGYREERRRVGWQLCAADSNHGPHFTREERPNAFDDTRGRIAVQLDDVECGVRGGRRHR